MRAVVVSVVAPAPRSGSGLIVQPERELGAVSLFLLAVVAAAVVGGIWAGIGSSVLGFLALNYFFTEPLHTFRVNNRDDVVALVVFLVVALLVGLGGRSRRVRARPRDPSRAGGPPAEPVRDQGAVGRAARTRAERPRGGARRCAPPGELRRSERRRGGSRRTRFDGRAPARPKAPPSRSRSRAAMTRSGPSPPSRPAREEFPAEDRRLLEAAASQIAVDLERASLDAEIAAARLDAERSQARAALFSSVTHDLRTPLASIKTAVTSLLQVDVRFDPTQARELLQTVLEETDRLNRLVGNILGLAQVRAGRAATGEGAHGARRGRRGRPAPPRAQVRGRPGPDDLPRRSRRPGRPGPDRSGPVEPARERGPLLAAGRRGHRLGRAVALRRAGSGGRSGPGDRAGGPRSRVRAVHATRVDRSGRDGRQRSRARDLPGDRARARRPDLDRGDARRVAPRWCSSSRLATRPRSRRKPRRGRDGS